MTRDFNQTYALFFELPRYGTNGDLFGNLLPPQSALGGVVLFLEVTDDPHLAPGYHYLTLKARRTVQ